MNTIQNATSSEIVFYDILEHEAWRDTSSSVSQSDWYGTLVKVDTSALEKITNGNGVTGCATHTCALVVYYAYSTANDFDGLKAAKDYLKNCSDAFYTTDSNEKTQNYDFTNSATTATVSSDNKVTYWTTSVPDGATVIAVAIDCTKDSNGDSFTFAATSTIKEMDVILVMQAPASFAGAAETNQYARNEALIFSKAKTDAGVTPLYSSASVTSLEKLNPTITKESDPSSGDSADDPGLVGNGKTLEYTLDITNTNKYFSISNVVEDVIPEGLAVDQDNILVYLEDDSANALTIENSPLADLTGSQTNARYTNANGEETIGLKLIFNIKGSIRPRETVHIVIPTTVNANTTGEVLKNTAVITSVDGNALDVSSNTTYHLVMAALTVYKTVDGLMGSKVKQFEFELTVTGNGLPESITYTKTDEVGTQTTGKLTETTTGTGSGNRTFTFTIAHGESISIGLPVDATYSLKETNAVSSGYTVSYTVDGQTQPGNVTTDRQIPLDGESIYFNNTRNSIIPTSGDLGTWLLILFAVAAGIGGVVIVRRRRRRRAGRGTDLRNLALDKMS